MNDPTTMLYRMPGPHQLQDGNYDHCVVLDQDIEQTVSNGWFRTPAEAKAAFEAAQAEPSDALPTRDELEQKATELGLAFSANIGDKKLAERIAEKLKG